MKKFSSIKRVNSRHTSRNNKIRNIAVIAVVVLGLLVAVPSLFAVGASLVFSPIYAFQTWVDQSSDSFPRYLRDRNELIDEINHLKSQLASQRGEQFTVELLTKENEELRSLLSDTKEKRIVAGIIGRPSKLPYDTLVLDKGHHDGIVENAPVFAGNTILGTVRKVFDNSSVVELVTTPGFTASVFIYGPNIYTTALGMGGGQLRVSVPQGITLTEGDLVILPSAAMGVYGSISVVDSIPTRPEQYGYVSPEIPISSLRLVSVGDAPLEPISFEEAQAIVAQTHEKIFEFPAPEGVFVTVNGSSTSSSTVSSANSSTTEPSNDL